MQQKCREPHNPIMRWLPSHVPFADVDAGDVGGRAGPEGQTRHVGEAEDCVDPTSNEHTCTQDNAATTSTSQ